MFAEENLFIKWIYGLALVGSWMYLNEAYMYWLPDFKVRGDVRLLYDTMQEFLFLPLYACTFPLETISYYGFLVSLFRFLFQYG